MAQAADVRPEPNLQRKAAVAHGGVLDHAGRVRIQPIPDFDLDRTIFQTLKGRAERFIMKKRIGNAQHWDEFAASAVESSYREATADLTLPPVEPELLQFLVDECDFDVEHADGSFLDHLYFCYEYGVKHYPERSPLPLLLHSVLGTGTNTFAMTADKIPALQALLSESDWRQVQAFPSVLRLLYDDALRAELRANVHRPQAITSVRMHRVIDDQPIELTGEEFWVALNYQLVHLVDFMPVANWASHMNDTSYILFRELLEILEQSGKLEAHIAYQPPPGGQKPQGEPGGIGSMLANAIPVNLAQRFAVRSIRRFSSAIGHSLEYTITWA